jgi:protein phosphatase 1 regulatory subunit 7
MKKLLFAFIAFTMLACSSDDSAPANPNNGNPNPENPNPENPNPEECTNVYTGNVWLKTQAEVDAFAANGYCKIDGQLSIGSKSFSDPTISDITNISGLAGLKEVNGIVLIKNNPQLTSLEGLNNLKRIGGYLAIMYNNGLTNLNGLSSLALIQSAYTFGLRIESNNALVSLEGLENVQEVSYLDIISNPLLQNFQGLNGLKKVTQLFVFAENNALSSFQGLENLETVHNCAFNQGQFTSFEGLNALKNVNKLSLFDCNNLVSFEGLENIEVLLSLEVESCDALESFNGLQNMKKISNLSITSNSSLATLTHFSGLTSFFKSPDVMNNNFHIGNNGALESLDGLQNLTQFEGTLLIRWNGALDNFCALSNVLPTAVLDTNSAINNNLYNPTVQNIIAGNCSQP